MMRMTDMVKHLLIINIIFFIGSYAVPQAKELLTMYYFESDKFRFGNLFQVCSCMAE